MPDHKIDVLMTTYNSAHFLEETISSIINQTHKNFKLVIVDDGSTDNTGSVLEKFSRSDERILVLKKENGGIVSAINHGIKYCDAEFIARHDADDLSAPDRFEVQLTYLLNNPDCVAVSAQLRNIDENGTYLGSISPTDCSVRSDNSSIPAIEPYIMQPLMMARSAAIHETGGYRNLCVAEDSDLCWRLSDIGRLHTIPRVLGSYRTHSGSITRSSIVRGRQMAVWSQLAALSDQRRKNKKTDIQFDDALFKKLKPLSLLSEMVEVSRKYCENTGEENWLKFSMCAKLLDVCYYKPYLPEYSDIVFIKKTIESNKNFYKSPSCAFLRQAMQAMSVRLILKGKILNALRLTAWPLWPALIPRAILFSVLSEENRIKLKKLLKPERH
ncbi:glycosyltransferase family 2 protein [Acetobacter fallax]|uniref:Glycosyltransferase n=1 Tax=Acetobacter fallax TaxID=1737473 RepID=A0ABX0K9M6_9PROT|nr:glycosyltransferase [Acetobacter fallax]NHO31230.1 glycosyltransferase [Acetobacter fallax]NHO34787.1 glycosyltransferase [Acetobacter fallax]